MRLRPRKQRVMISDALYYDDSISGKFLIYIFILVSDKWHGPNKLTHHPL